jgi:hypothetical protein
MLDGVARGHDNVLGRKRGSTPGPVDCADNVRSKAVDSRTAAVRTNNNIVRDLSHN